MNASSSSSSVVTYEYRVLYYKRSNSKVHKSKGVSKMDGVLTVHLPPLSKVTLRDTRTESSQDDEQDSEEQDDSDDDDSQEEHHTTKRPWLQQQQRKKQKHVHKNKKTASRPTAAVAGGGILVSSIQREIADKAASDSLLEDDMVSLGPYDVVILNRLLAPTEQAPSAAVAAAPKSQSGMNRTEPRPAMTKSVQRSILPTRILNSNRTATTGWTRGTNSNHLLLRHREPPKVTTPPATFVAVAQPQPAVPRSSNSSSSSSKPFSSSSKSSAALATSKKTNKTTSLPLVLPAKRPLAATFRKTPQPPLPHRSHTSSTTGIASAAVAMDAATSVLPHIPLPACIRSALRPHQITGVDFVYRALTGPLKGCILADEMGLGKTLMAVAVICALHRRNRDKHFVVVCPSSLVSNWANEFDKWIGKASQPKRVVIRRGGSDGLQQMRAYFGGMKKKTAQHHGNNAGQVLIISYDLFRMYAQQFQTTTVTTSSTITAAAAATTTTSAGLLVVDEGHRLKNKNGSLTLTALESLASDARLCLTATPIQNELTEFYSLAHFCSPGILGDLNAFRRDFERPIANANRKCASSEQRELGLVQSNRLEQITKTLVLRRLQTQVLKSMLLPRMEALLFCKPSPLQCSLYQRLAANQQSSSTAISGAGSISDALTALTKLRKVCAHPFLATENNNNNNNATGNVVSLSGKLEVLDVLLQSIRTECPNDKVVIVSNFTSVLTLIESMVLEPRQFPSVRLDGTVELDKRQGLVDTFNRTSAERTFCFLLSSKAGGCGLNLVGANKMILFDPDWNPASDIQAMGRVYRQGQTKACTIYRLFTAGTCEEVMYQRQWQKGGLAAMTVDHRPNGSGQTTGRFTKEELADCFTLVQDCCCDTKRKVGSMWPDYHGPDSLMGCCTDAPLLQTARALPVQLRHIHIVPDNAHDAKPPPPLSFAVGGDDRDDSKSDSGNHDELSSCSEAEFEFGNE